MFYEYEIDDRSGREARSDPAAGVGDGRGNGAAGVTAPDGAVFDACEQAVIEKGRNLQAQMLGEAVSRRIETAEKKGRRSASAPADATRKIADPKNAA